MAILGLPITQTSSGYVVPTEFAATAFGMLAGIGGAASQIIASNRLSKVSGDQIPFRSLGVPLAITILASAGSAFFIPTDV